MFFSLFQKPSKADTGDYKCSAKNKWGNDHTTFALGQEANFVFVYIKLTILSVFLMTFHLPFYQTPVKSDAGEYKCSVKNKWGTDYTTFQLG